MLLLLLSYHSNFLFGDEWSSWHFDFALLTTLHYEPARGLLLTVRVYVQFSDLTLFMHSSSDLIKQGGLAHGLGKTAIPLMLPKATRAKRFLILSG